MSLLPVSTQAPCSASARCEVVLVDDDAATLRAWGLILETFGFAVVCCGSAREALQAIGEGCDCVITDYHMRDMTGVELIRSGRSVSRAVFIMMTGDDSPALHKAALAAGAVAVHVKPVPIKRLLEDIGRFCVGEQRETAA